MNNINNMNETWFSNQLAWLLDPNGSHGIGTYFIKEFLQTGKSKVLNESINLENFQVIREFYVDIKGRSKRRYIDIVMVDFVQNIMIVIENKLYGTNTKNQLSDNFNIEKMFPKMQIKYMYVYLKQPLYLDSEPNETKRKNVQKMYIQKSWSDDINPILESKKENSFQIFQLSSNIKKALMQSTLDYKREIKEFIVEVLNTLEMLHPGQDRKWGIQNSRITRIGGKKVNGKNSISFIFPVDGNSATIRFNSIKYVVPFDMEEKQQKLMLTKIALRAFNEMKSNASLDIDANEVYKKLNLESIDVSK